MAKNYTLKVVKSVRAQGSLSVQQTMEIFPNPGYTVNSDDFSHGTLPSGVESVVFNAIGGKGLINSKINVVVTLSSYAMPNNDAKISIPIVGVARLYTEPVLIPIKLSIPQSINGSSNAVISNTNPSVSSSISNNVITFEGNISQEQDDPEEYELVATLVYDVTSTIINDNTITGVSTDNIFIPDFSLLIDDSVYEITHSQTINNYVSNSHSSPYIVTVDPTQENTNDSLHGLAHKQTANIYVNTKIPIVSGEVYKIEISNGSTKEPSVTIPPTVTKQLKAIEFGNLTIDSRGETRTITVYGDVGSQFKFFAIDAGADGTGTSAFTSGSFYNSANVEFTIASSTSFSKGQSSVSFTLILPAKTTSHVYKIYVEPISGTTTSGQLPLTGSRQTLNQHPNPTLTMQVTNTSSGTFRLGRNHTHGIIVPTGGLITNVFTDNPQYFSLYYEIYARDGTSVLDRVGSSDPIVPTFNSSGTSTNGWSNSNKGVNGGYHLEVSGASTSFFAAGSNTPMTSGYVNAERVVIKADFIVIEQGVKAVTMSLDLENILAEVRN